VARIADADGLDDTEMRQRHAAARAGAAEVAAAVAVRQNEATSWSGVSRSNGMAAALRRVPAVMVAIEQREALLAALARLQRGAEMATIRTEDIDKPFPTLLRVHAGIPDAGPCDIAATDQQLQTVRHEEQRWTSETIPKAEHLFSWLRAAACPGRLVEKKGELHESAPASVVAGEAETSEKRRSKANTSIAQNRCICSALGYTELCWTHTERRRTQRSDAAISRVMFVSCVLAS
jgi:hypothetical protein